MRERDVARLENHGKWIERWADVKRPYSAKDAVGLRGSMKIEHTVARLGAQRLWRMLHTEPYIRALGAQTGAQAVQMVQAGLKAIYVSGWQVAGDMNTAGQTYPDQSLYPVDSVPNLVRRINNALQRADEITQSTGLADQMPHWHAPLVADAEAGFGGVLNAFELMKAMIEAGAAAVHFEDQLSSSKKCGHMGGKVLVPTQEAIAKLVAARLAADVLDVPTLDRRPHRCPGGEAAHQRYRSPRPAVSHGAADGGRVPRRAGRPGSGHRPGSGLRPLCRLGLVRDRDARSGGGPLVRRRDPRPLPAQAVGLQLLAVVQLEAIAQRRADRRVPTQPGGHGLPVPVRHPGRLPCPEHDHVRAGPRLPRRGHAGLFAAATARVRPGAGPWLSGRQAPGLRRRGIL